MERAMTAHVSKNQRVWIKSPKGNVYVCPVDFRSKLKDPSNPTEEELLQLCVDDSTRPDNY
jgi:hypothetical protein